VASHAILSQVDQALAAYLVSVGAGTTEDIHPAKRSEDKAVPNTICYARQWRMLSPNSGVYVVQAHIVVTTNPCLDEPAQLPEEKEEASKDRVSATWDAFFAGVDSDSADLAAAITAASGLSDFTIQSCEVVGGDAGYGEKGNTWRDGLDLEIVCCPRSV